MTVNGYLDLRDCNLLTKLPKCLTVYDLYLTRSGITALPDDLTVKSNITLAGTQIARLPDNFTVNGCLDLQDCKLLTALPRGLTVKDDLYLTGSGVTALPADLTVRGSIAR